MRILFNEGDKPCYALQKDDPGWSLWRYKPERVVDKGQHKGNVIPAGYVTMNKYPHNIKHAIMIMVEDHMDGKVGDFELKAVMKDITGWLKELDVYAEGIEDLVGEAHAEPVVLDDGTLEVVYVD